MFSHRSAIPINEKIPSHSQTLSSAISQESRRDSFCTQLGAWAESLPHLVVPSSTQHSQTRLCHLLYGPCPGHFWLYQTWMSAVSLRGPYSIGKGNYFRFLEIKKKKYRRLGSGSRNRNKASFYWLRQHQTFPPCSYHHAPGALATGSAPQHFHNI